MNVSLLSLEHTSIMNVPKGALCHLCVPMCWLIACYWIAFSGASRVQGSLVFVCKFSGRPILFGAELCHHKW